MEIKEHKFHASKVEMWRFIKYCLTGVLNTGISYIVYAMFLWIHLPVHVALAIGYIGGMATSFTINARWTFQKDSGLRWTVGGLFIIANGCLLLISEETLRWILSHVTESPYVGQVINLVPTTIFGFIVNRWVFLRKPSAGVVAKG